MCLESDAIPTRPTDRGRKLEGGAQRRPDRSVLGDHVAHCGRKIGKRLLCRLLLKNDCFPYRRLFGADRGHRRWPRPGKGDLKLVVRDKVFGVLGNPLFGKRRVDGALDDRQVPRTHKDKPEFSGVVTKR